MVIFLYQSLDGFQLVVTMYQEDFKMQVGFTTKKS